MCSARKAAENSLPDSVSIFQVGEKLEYDDEQFHVKDRTVYGQVVVMIATTGASIFRGNLMMILLIGIKWIRLIVKSDQSQERDRALEKVLAQRRGCRPLALKRPKV